MNDCYLSLLLNFRALLSIDSGANLVNSKQAIGVILEESYNLFTHKRFGRMTGNWVTNWQPYLFLRFAVSCLT